MKLSLSLITLLLSSFATSEGLSFSLGGQKPLGDGEPVPGNNPLTYCQAEHSDDILVLDHVNLTPNPPQAYVYILVQHPIMILANVLSAERHSPSKLSGNCKKMSRRVHTLSYKSSGDWLDWSIPKRISVHRFPMLI